MATSQPTDTSSETKPPSKGEEKNAPKAPVAASTSQTPTTVTITWKPIPGATTYAVQMNSNPKLPEDGWVTLSTRLKAPAMRKKNLKPSVAYFFRVRGLSEAGEYNSPWSEVSAAISTAAGVNPVFRNLLGNKLLQNVRGKPGKAPTVDLNELGGGLVALYFSASWCPPCRQFTPMLEKFHSSVRKSAGPGKFEVVFVSSDRDKGSFDEYFANHHGNWFALPFDAQRQREQCGSYFQVKGIPTLIVFAPNGTIVCPNAVGQPLNMSTLAQWQSLAGSK